LTRPRDMRELGIGNTSANTVIGLKTARLGDKDRRGELGFGTVSDCCEMSTQALVNHRDDRSRRRADVGIMSRKVRPAPPTVTAPFTQEMGRNLAPFFDLKSEAIGRKSTY
jgi:hypothetical protein